MDTSLPSKFEAIERFASDMRPIPTSMWGVDGWVVDTCIGTEDLVVVSYNDGSIVDVISPTYGVHLRRIIDHLHGFAYHRVMGSDTNLRDLMQFLELVD